VVPGQRRFSNDFSVETSGSTEYGKDSIAMVQQKKGATKERQSGGRGEGAKSSGAGFTSTAAVLGTGLHRNSQDRSRVSRRWSTTMTDQTDPVLGALPSGTPPVQYREHYSYNNNDGYYNDMDDDSQEDSCSLSLTPPSSDDEVDGVVITGEFAHGELRLPLCAHKIASWELALTSAHISYSPRLDDFWQFVRKTTHRRRHHPRSQEEVRRQ
jgi:hypothetical protein